MSTPKDTLKLFWKYSWRYPVLLVSTLLVLPTGILAESFAIPYIGASILNTLAKNPHTNLRSFTSLLIVAVIVEIYGVLAWRLAIWLIWSHQIKVAQDMITDIFDHLLSQSEQFHSDHFGGALVSATNKFVGSYYRISDIAVFNYFSLVLIYIFIIVILAPLAPLFVAILFLISILFGVAVVRIRRRELPFNEKLSLSESRLTAQLADTVTNISTTRAFGQEALERKLFLERAHRVTRNHLKVVRESNHSELITGGFVRGLSIVSLIISIVVVTHLGAPLGTILLISSYMGVLFGQLWALGYAIKGSNRAMGDAKEMTGLLATDIDVKEVINPEKVRFDAGEITFDKVTFRYNEEATRNVFSDLSFRITSGQRVGLVGPSGGGKTTITKLLLRFADIQKGTITIDGQDIANVHQSDLRQHIAYVPQEPLLFHRSLMDNIRYGRLDATDKEVQAVAQRSRAEEFIDVLPKGYETLVGERGTKLSGGQRQRIAIARAMLKDAPILVLDEATSALDSHSEKLIQEALRELMAGRTTIVIAHRLSTISELDRIIVLDNGKIAEDGHHAKLLEENGLYAKLWAHQSGGFITEDDEEE